MSYATMTIDEQDAAMRNMPGGTEETSTVVFSAADGNGWASVHGGAIEDVRRWLWEDEMDGKVREEYTVARTPNDLPRRVKFALERLWDEKISEMGASHPDM